MDLSLGRPSSIFWTFSFATNRPKLKIYTIYLIVSHHWPCFNLLSSCSTPFLSFGVALEPPLFNNELKNDCRTSPPLFFSVDPTETWEASTTSLLVAAFVFCVEASVAKNVWCSAYRSVVGFKELLCITAFELSCLTSTDASELTYVDGKWI